MQNNRSKTRLLALTGIICAGITIALIFESIAPTGRLGFYVLSAFLLSVILLQCGVYYGWAGYAVTCLTGFVLVPEKLNLIPYVAFFGIYTLVKYHIESIRKMWLEIILKLAAFNLFLWPAWNIAKVFLPEYLTEGTGILIAGIVLQVVFLLYDFLFTYWVRYYYTKIAPRLNKR